MRSWCYIDDFIEGIRLLTERERTDTYEAYNVGSDENLTMEEVARTICEELGASSELVEVVRPPTQFMSPIKIASIEKMRRLGYDPKIPLREGVRYVAQWQDDAGH